MLFVCVCVWAVCRYHIGKHAVKCVGQNRGSKRVQERARKKDEHVHLSPAVYARIRKVIIPLFNRPKQLRARTVPRDIHMVSLCVHYTRQTDSAASYCFFFSFLASQRIVEIHRNLLSILIQLFLDSNSLKISLKDFYIKVSSHIFCRDSHHKQQRNCNFYVGIPNRNFQSWHPLCFATVIYCI